MKVDIRYKVVDGEGRPRSILLIAESKEESLLLDNLGSEVNEDGLIAEVHGQLRLADGYATHYIELVCP